MAPSEKNLPKEERLRLLDLLYASSTCPEHEKAEARAQLLAALDKFRADKGFTQQQIIDYLRTFHYQDYYRMRKKQEPGSV